MIKKKRFWSWILHNVWFYIITIGWIIIEVLVTYDSNIPTTESPLISLVIFLLVYFSIWIGIFAIFYKIRRKMKS